MPDEDSSKEFVITSSDVPCWNNTLSIWGLWLDRYNTPPYNFDQIVMRVSLQIPITLGTASQFSRTSIRLEVTVCLLVFWATWQAHHFTCTKVGAHKNWISQGLVGELAVVVADLRVAGKRQATRQFRPLSIDNFALWLYDEVRSPCVPDGAAARGPTRTQRGAGRRVVQYVDCRLM